MKLSTHIVCMRNLDLHGFILPLEDTAIQDHAVFSQLLAVRVALQGCNKGVWGLGGLKPPPPPPPQIFFANIIIIMCMLSKNPHILRDIIDDNQSVQCMCDEGMVGVVVQKFCTCSLQAPPLLKSYLHPCIGMYAMVVICIILLSNSCAKLATVLSRSLYRLLNN